MAATKRVRAHQCHDLAVIEAHSPKHAAQLLCRVVPAWKHAWRSAVARGGCVYTPHAEWNPRASHHFNAHYSSQLP
eukprot:CAMPEP_0195595104 /NCGR_PEP_ID=MMETSP0815-20121206/1763_1 /TAXON_ID=97485 /ORGANISM="Prymnesium parvum, Strain Texoma1" /LENGTH=75 /DNA_ID=CAMNT_0040734335 /DNA_START=159 /DNA_END=386 /DNA_ORIENTATION=-